MKVIFLYIFVLLFTGCSSYTPRPFIQSDGNGEIYTSDTSAVSTTHIRKKDGRRIICMAPPPDASFSQTDSSSLDISLFKSEANSAEDATSIADSTNESELAGRTPTVLLAREIFYRTCEISDNFDLEKKEAIALFKESLNVISKNWAGESENTKITIGETMINSRQEMSAGVSLHQSSEPKSTLSSESKDNNNSEN